MSNSLRTIYLTELFVCLLSATAGELEEDKSAICKIADTTALKRVETDKTPSYFFRPFPNSEFVSYASNSQNFILSLETGSEVLIPGPYDPVPTHDDLVMTVPPGKGMEFYSIEKLKAGDKTALLKDPELTGVYQSIGTLEETADSTTIRIISDKDGLSYRDYEIIKQNGEPVQVKPLGKGTTRLCANLRLSLPMISKSGNEIAALDVEAGVTKIYSFDSKTGTCKEKLSLGMSTGKVDFNYNGDELAFHVLNNDSENEYYFDVPSDNYMANVFVLKRSTGDISQITQNTHSSSVFPAWRKDGKLVYLHHPTRGSKEKSSFILADPKKASSIPLRSVQSTQCNDPTALRKSSELATIGALFAKLCSDYGDEVTAGAALLKNLSLNRERCVRLINRYFEGWREDILKNEALMKSSQINPDVIKDIKREDLQKMCPTENHGDTGMGEKESEGQSLPPIPPVCLECHLEQIPFDDWKALSTKKAKSGRSLKEEILHRIGTTGEERMPPEGHLLSEKQKALFESYIKTGNY